MYMVKSKVTSCEKSELEMAQTKNKLDALLQCLLENSYMDREHLEKEAWKTHWTPTARISPSLWPLVKAHFYHQ
uniref:Uncharacterized protein n=1 Tax=Sus scrofa TaxID=9823 RepID=A0A4X1TJF0_PIG